MPDYTLYRVKLSTLTPLHIGSGRDLMHEYDYAIHNGQTWRINEAALLDDQPLDDPKLADRLAATPPARLLRTGDYRADSPFFRYVIKGVPRAQGEKAQVREQLKDLYDRPYLPGSSLKGALRTVLAWQLWADRGVQPEARRLGRSRQWAGQDFERDLLGRDPNHDLMRALHVSDSVPLPADRLMLANARVIGRGGKLGSPIELEIIRPDTTLELTAKIDNALFSDWARRSGLQLPGAERLLQLPQVASSHAAARLDREIRWFDEISGAHRVAGFYRQIQNARIGKHMFLLQLGWGAGWQSKTFGTHLQGAPAFMERIIGDYMLARGSRRQGDPFPKSRRVAVAFTRDAGGRPSETPAAPFGWVLVEMVEAA